MGLIGILIKCIMGLFLLAVAEKQHLALTIAMSAILLSMKEGN